MSKKPAINEEAVRKALRRAQQGKGHQLAVLLKSVSTEDLARALSGVGPHYVNVNEGDGFLFGLVSVFAWVEGIRKGKADFVEWKKDARRQRKEELARMETEQ